MMLAGSGMPEESCVVFICDPAFAQISLQILQIVFFFHSFCFSVLLCFKMG